MAVDPLNCQSASPLHPCKHVRIAKDGLQNDEEKSSGAHGCTGLYRGKEKNVEIQCDTNDGKTLRFAQTAKERPGKPT